MSQHTPSSSFTQPQGSQRLHSFQLCIETVSVRHAKQSATGAMSALLTLRERGGRRAA